MEAHMEYLQGEALDNIKDAWGEFKTVNGLPLTECSICQAHFADKTDLEEHFKSHADDIPHKCLECCVGFTEQRLFFDHMKTVHEGSKEFTASNPDFVLRQMKREDRDVPQPSAIKTNSITRRSSVRAGRPEKIRRLNKDPLKCQVCQKVFTDPRKFYSHTETHGWTEMKHKCKLCTRRFMNAGAVRSHMIHLHRFYLCSICEEGFSTNEGRINHEVTHKGLKKTGYPVKKSQLNKAEPGRSEEAEVPQCWQCSKTFLSTDDLSDHMKVHSKEKQYLQFKCPVCGNCYSTRDYLVSHLKGFKLCREVFEKSKSLSSQPDGDQSHNLSLLLYRDNISSHDADISVKSHDIYISEPSESNTGMRDQISSKRSTVLDEPIIIDDAESSQNTSDECSNLLKCFEEVSEHVENQHKKLTKNDPLTDNDPYDSDDCVLVFVEKLGKASKK